MTFIKKMIDGALDRCDFEAISDIFGYLIVDDGPRLYYFNSELMEILEERDFEHDFTRKLEELTEIIRGMFSNPGQADEKNAMTSVGTCCRNDKEWEYSPESTVRDLIRNNQMHRAEIDKALNYFTYDYIRNFEIKSGKPLEGSSIVDQNYTLEHMEDTLSWLDDLIFNMTTTQFANMNARLFEVANSIFGYYGSLGLGMSSNGYSLELEVKLRWHIRLLKSETETIVRKHIAKFIKASED